MPKTRPPYAAEFRQQMVDLVRAVRTPEDLAREFEPSSPGDADLGGPGRPRCRSSQRRAAHGGA
jgi:hypothetical protein